MDIKRKSQKQEKAVAKDLRGRVTPASGALWGAKGDVRTEKFLVECKTTNKCFYTLTSNIWRKIKDEAIKDGLRIPVMCIEVGSESFAVVELSMVLDLFVLNNISYCPQTISAKSFRINSQKCEYPQCYYCYWGKHNTLEKLIVMPWEELLEISEKI